MFAILRDDKARRIGIQAAVIGLVTFVVVSFVVTTKQNLDAQGMTSGFAFLERGTGWDIPFYLLDYSIRSPYWKVLLIGFLNTLVVGLTALFFATILGTLIGIARISKNPLLRLLSTTYIEIFRNIPLILQAFLWYAIAINLPPPRRAYEFGEAVYLSSRGVFLPGLNVSAGAVVVFLVACVALVIAVALWRRRRSAAGAAIGPWASAAAFLGVIGVALVALIVFGREAGESIIDIPVRRGLRFEGGIRIIPEFSALTFAIVAFGSAYIAEIVRGGFNAVSRGQLECARALGLRPWMVLWHVHIPLAMRAIVPPLGNMYVWLMKATTVGIAIGFSDFFMIVSTSINQSGQTIELLFLMMLGFFIINYTIATLMNRLNRAIALKGYESDTKTGGAEL